MLEGKRNLDDDRILLGLFPWIRVEFRVFCGYSPPVKLKTDYRGRITSRELFKPNTAYEAERDGNRIVMVELVPKEPLEAPLVKLIRSPEGFLMLSPRDASRVEKQDIRRAVRMDRDAQ